MPYTHFNTAKAVCILSACVLLLSASVDSAFAVSPSAQNQGTTETPTPPNVTRAGNNSGGSDGGGGGGTPLKIQPGSNLILLQPLDDSTHSLSPRPGIQIFFDYFNLSWPWILGVSAGLAVLQAMIGGMMMMTVSEKENGKSRMMWATIGLLIIALAGMILSTINPLFYA